MKNIIINGAALVDTKTSKDGNTLIVRCVKNTSVSSKEGGWQVKPNYFSMLLKGAARERFERMNAKPGSSMYVLGRYDLSTYEAESKTYLNMAVIPADFGYSSGSTGTAGLWDVTLTDIGIVSEPTVVSDKFAYVDGLYDIGYGESKRTLRVRLCITGAIPSCIGKGKRVDVIGRLDVTLNQGKDGKTYINETVFVKEINKAPYTARKAPAPAPEENAHATEPEQEPTQVDLSDFEEVTSSDSVFF